MLITTNSTTLRCALSDAVDEYVYRGCAILAKLLLVSAPIGTDILGQSRRTCTVISGSSLSFLLFLYYIHTNFLVPRW